MDDVRIPPINEGPTSHLLEHPRTRYWRTGSGAPDSDGPATLSFRAVEPVNLYIKDLTIGIDLAPSALERLGAVFGKKKDEGRESKSRQKTVLNHVSARMPSGSLTAIIGASGSGKTSSTPTRVCIIRQADYIGRSLLNAISHRVNESRLRQSGSILYNGNTDFSSIRSAYVMQEDVLLPTLTVRETLQYAADLRLLPPNTTVDRQTIVEEVILELGLKECASTRIGNNTRKGCSGGEKRRTSLGVQMLANPSVLFLDEVTTGLDATSAFQLVQTLKHLASQGRTIVTTIHQPRSEIWGLFDHLVLLSEGCPIYSGPTNASLPYFKQLGYELPQFVNPAEYLIDLTAIDTRLPELEDTSRTRVEGLRHAWQTSSFLQASRNIHGEKEKLTQGTPKGESQRRQATFGRQVMVQTSRTLKTTIRDPMGIFGSLVEAISLGIIAGWIFVKLDGSLAGIRSREGALYTAAALQGYLILLFETYRLTVDIALFDRERSEGIVGVFSFITSRRLARIFVEDIPVPLIFSIIFYFFIGFRAQASQFFIFYIVALLCQLLSVTFAMVCVAAFRDFAQASLIANLTFTLQSICSGYFIQSNQIPVYVRWIKYISYVWYAIGALVSNEFLAHTSNPAGQVYDCPEPGGSSNPACKQYTGLYIAESLGVPSNWLWRPIVVLVGFIIAFFFASAFILKFQAVELVVSRARINERDHSAGNKQIVPPSRHDVRTVEVTLKDYSLNIQRRDPLGRKATKITILQPISTKFEPGILNVIMGPSGSGKTSLLNMMAHRLQSSLGTRYEPGGTMLFGGAQPSDSVVRSITSYVSQDDNALLTTLTVRETLHFAAGLRLPSWMSKEEKIRRAESVLLRLNLRDCADNLIGDDKKKGISGGEKRRVTIGVQVLTDPRILLLDEPTSGLDAFTANSIMDVLQGLAAEGRTVILTIHQPRSDLFRQFGNILLLARGGSPVYAGKGELMLPYFSTLGYECPRTTNPADFALDLVTVDLQHSTKEASSREKVRSLVSEWDQRKAEQVAVTTQISTPAELGSLKREMTPLHLAFPLLVRRSVKGFQRNPDAINARIAQVFGFAIIVTLFWAPLKSNYEAVQGRLGFVQQQMGLYFVGMLQNVAVYPYEQGVFYHEHDDRAYSVEAFFLQYTLLEIPFEIVSSILFAVLIDLAAGLPRNPRIFFIEAFNCFCIVNCGESVGIMFNTLFEHTGFAVNVTSVIMSVALLMAGVLSLKLPAFLQSFNHLSPPKWSVGNLAPYTLAGQIFTCTDSQQLANGLCPITTGEQVLQLYNLDRNPGLNLLALGICAVVYRIVAYLLLRAKRTPLGWKEGFRKGK